ncbi:hypothetical protein [Arthrobacter roseus]|uniref:hypothetical protein n=1 Tax=Arthrobacter roseus TaxID=136274 RepID=UPI0019653EBA|nr:hypothetical protein [Arthrobacter roseus]MBM7847066.1 uncharacterized membrane protein HdeD (DUF308 family) [Arthrobacter roseus]
MSSVSPETSLNAVWKPVLLRAAVAAVFGAVTIFWQDPSLAVLAVAGGLYFLLSGAAVWIMSRGRSLASARRLFIVEAGLFVTGAVLAFIIPTAVGFTVAAVIALGGSGVVELVLWAKLRKQLAVARDWLVTGVVGVGTALFLPLFVQLQAHALLGVVGGAAVIIAVFLLIAALTYRHEAPTRAVKA